MNTFELFCLMYNAFSTEENHKDFNFEDFLSDMDPFVWEDCGSADPAEFSEFSKFMQGKEIDMKDYGFSLINQYINQIERPWVDNPIPSYFKINQQEWIEKAKKYLSEPHKGSN